MGAEFYLLTIRAKTVFQRAILAKMRYELWRGQNRDLCVCYMGGERAILKILYSSRKIVNFWCFLMKIDVFFM